MRTLPHKVLVKVSKTHAQSIKIGDKELYLDSSYNPEKHIQPTGEVVAVPKRLNPIKSYHIPAGYPHPVREMTSEQAWERMMAMHPDDREVVPNPYDPSDYRETFITHNKAHTIELKVGDIVYFHRLFLSPNYLHYHPDGFHHANDEANVYSVPYHKIFCYVRDGEIHMINNFVLVSEVYDDDVVDIELPAITEVGIKDNLFKGGSTKAKLKKVGSLEIVTTSDVKEKKLEGEIISYPQERVEGYTPELKKGDRIVFNDKQKFKNKIEGKDYYVMKAEQITCAVKDGNLVPKGCTILIDPEPYEHDGILIREAEDIPSQIGKVISISTDVVQEGLQIDVGDRVLYEPHRTYNVDGYEQIVAHEGNIIAVLEKETKVKLSTKKT